MDTSEHIISTVFNDEGIFPNNHLPVIIYKNTVSLSESSPAHSIQQVFQKNEWGNSWINGLYSMHHYHSTAHEAIGISSGQITVMLGGPVNGKEFNLKKGDVVIIPAGVSHKNVKSSVDFRCVGAYPKGQTWDMNYRKPGEREKAMEKLKNVELPLTDPVFGTNGQLTKLWNK
ncbi:cupin domain-containing protein [Bacteroidota bacterium]